MGVSLVFCTHFTTGNNWSLTNTHKQHLSLIYKVIRPHTDSLTTASYRCHDQFFNKVKRPSVAFTVGLLSAVTCLQVPSCDLLEKAGTNHSPFILCCAQLLWACVFLLQASKKSCLLNLVFSCFEVFLFFLKFYYFRNKSIAFILGN